MAPRVWLPLVLVVIGCQSQSQTNAVKLLRESSQREFGSAGYLCRDAIAQAEAAGLNYPATVQAALHRDPRALDTLFHLCGHLDAAGAQGHAAVLGALLAELGDEFFAECLTSHEQEVKKLVAASISYDLGDECDPIANRELSERFPLTYAALFSAKHRRGAGAPAKPVPVR